MSSLLRSILSIFSGKVIGIFIGLIFTPILVRIISQAQYGLYASVLAGFSIVTLLSKGGIFDATRKIVAEYADNAEEVSSVISVSLLLSTTYGLFTTFFVFLSIHMGLIPSIYVPYAWALISVILFGNVFTTVRGTLYGLQRESTGEALQIARQLIFTISALMLAYVGYDVIGVFIGYALSFVFLGIVGLITLSKYLIYKLPDKCEITMYVRKVATFGGYQLVGGLSATLLYKSDILLVEFFRGQTATALYQSAIVPAEMIWFVPSAIQLAFLQHTTNLWTDGKIDEINKNLQTGLKYAVLSLTLFGVGIFVLADPFLSIYFGAGYVGASTTLRVLIFGTFFFGVTRVVVPVLQATGRVRQTELITVGALFINILLNVILIPRYGIIGAGFGTGISYISIFVGNIILWERSPFKLVSLEWIGKLVLVQGLFSIIFLIIVSHSDFSPLISLLIFSPVGLVMFLCINILFGYVPIQPIKTYLDSIVRYRD
ncbi:flippase [Halomontanus rarus]|uniref:flippase n=1 Tax=Halomontanus rarus TaxID=3034020 RepID=UPI0023E8B428|nr:flippase [Halovivax sp. TS33]